MKEIITKEIESYGTIKITDKGRAFLKAPSSFIITEDHDYEKLGNFPNDRNKLLHKLKRHNKKTILISGDRHRSGIYKKDNIYEITASSLNKPGSSFFETDKYLLNETYPQANFGLLKIHKKTIDIEIKDKYGKILNSVSIDY